jgi:hypothetical protein
MRTRIRVLLATLLTIPLAATVAAAPGAAGPPERAAGTYERLLIRPLVLGTIDGLEGNAHVFGIRAENPASPDLGTFESYNCGPETDPAGTAGEDMCEVTGWYRISSTDYVLEVGTRLRNARLTGTLTLSADEATVVSSLPVDVLLTAEGRPATMKVTYAFVDPDGSRSRQTTTTAWASGPVSGTLGGIPVVSKDGGSIKVESWTQKLITR